MTTLASAAGSALDEVLANVSAHAHKVLTTQERLRGLVRANQLVASALDLPAVLRSIVDAALDLLGATTVALHVTDGTGMTESVYSGLAHPVVAAIKGNTPEGKNIHEMLMAGDRVVWFSDISPYLSRSEQQIERRCLLGAPIRVRGRVLGSIYLIGASAGRVFGEDDEELLVALASSAAVAIDHARLYSRAQQRLRWLKASAEIARVTLGVDDSAHWSAAAFAVGGGCFEDELAGPFQEIVDLVAEIADARAVLLTPGISPGMRRQSGVRTLDRGSDGDEAPCVIDHLVVRAASGAEDLAPVGALIPTNATLVGRVWRTGRARFESEVSLGPSRDSIAGTVSPGPAMLLPLRSGREVLGILCCFRRHGSHVFNSDEIEGARKLADQAAMGLQVARARARAYRARQREAVMDDRDRIARDLHDVVIQRLFAISLRLQGLWTLYSADPHVGETCENVTIELDTAIQELRRSIFDLRSRI